jgi:hypothetical protein
MMLLNLPQELNQLKIMQSKMPSTDFQKSQATTYFPKMPLSIQLRAQDVQNLYPIAMSL